MVAPEVAFLQIRHVVVEGVVLSDVRNKSRRGLLKQSIFTKRIDDFIVLRSLLAVPQCASVANVAIKINQSVDAEGVRKWISVHGMVLFGE